MDLLREVEVFVKDHLGYVELPVLEVSYSKSVVIEKKIKLRTLLLMSIASCSELQGRF